MIKKTIIFITSLLFTLVLAEVGLRVTGAFLLNKKIHKESVSLAAIKVEKTELEKSETRILTLGDSVTFGGWGVADKSYPSYLSDFLKKQPEKYKVINNGMCGNTTRTILAGLESYLSFHKPDIVVLLIGAANRYRFNEYDLASNVLDNEKWFQGLRVIKVFTFVYKELINRFNKYYAKSNMKYANVEEMWIEYNPLKDTDLRKRRDKILAENKYKNSIELLIRLSHLELNLENYKQAESYLKYALVLNPYSNDVKASLGFYYSGLASRSNIPRVALGHYMKAVANGPNDGYIASIAKPLITNFEMQSVVQAKEVFEVLKNKLDDDQNLKKNKIFTSLLWYFKEGHKNKDKISNWIRSDLEKIVKIIKKSNVKLILQNYHVSYLAANRHIEEIAKEYEIPLVDNTAAFKKIISNDNEYRRFIKDDDHCTNEGHEVIAQNVMKEILKL